MASNHERLKMNQNATCSTSNEADFDESTSDFSGVVRRRDFVDKTLLLRTLFEVEPKMILVTCPRRFGKTTNMDMIKRFVELKVDDNGRKDVSNRRIFEDNNLLICEDLDFFDQHFATYPVIHATFKAVSGTNYLDPFREVLHDTFQRHAYLLKSDKLSPSDIAEFNLYFEITYKKLKNLKVAQGLAFLSECLYKHFGNKKVFILIDEYDAPTINTMYSQFLRGICSHTFNLIWNRYVERALLTGTSYVASICLDGACNVRKYKFLDDHPFVKYYGLTEDEVGKLLSKFKINDDVSEKLKSHYNGYTTLNGVKLFSIWSILSFLRERKIENFWAQSGAVITKLEQAMDIPDVRLAIESFCLGHSVATQILRRVQICDIIKLKRICAQNKGPETLENPDVYLNFIFQLGYLTFDGKLSDTTCRVRVPNAEIISEFKHELCRYYDSTNLVGNSVALFNEISSSSEDKVFEDFIAEFNTMLDKLSDKFVKKNEHTYHCIMLYILRRCHFSVETEFNISSRRLDLISFKDGLGIIVGLKYKESSMEALRQITNQNLLSCFKDGEKICVGVNLSENNVADMSVLVNSTDISKARCF